MTFETRLLGRIDRPISFRFLRTAKRVGQAEPGDMVAHLVTNTERRAIDIGRVDRTCAEVDVEIFALDRPMSVEFDLRSATHRKAGVGAALRQSIRRSCWIRTRRGRGTGVTNRSRLREIETVFAFADRETAGDEQQPVFRRVIARAQAQRCEPREFPFTAQHRGTARAWNEIRYH